LDQNLSSAALAEYSPDGQWVAWQNASDGSLWRSRTDGTEYRLIGLAPGDLPVVSARTSTVNLYSVDLNER
jgi:hypothetical protein